MNIRKIFRGISNKLMEDFNISSEIKHSGSKGDYRENALSTFLTTNRLPIKFGVGNGEIIGLDNDISHQADLIIYDRLSSIPLLYDSVTQIYPIESVYGIIEVKSKLSKQKLIEGLENIKNFKQLSPSSPVVHRNQGYTATLPRQRPFGIIFAYSLSDNSLDSLIANVNEWQTVNTYEHWPNLIVVLNEGIIYHYGPRFSKLIFSDSLAQSKYISAIHWQKDTFFKFYSVLLRLCSGVMLGEMDIEDYYELPIKVGNYSVKNHDRFVGKDDNGEVIVSELTLDFIEKIVSWCRADGIKSFRTITFRQFGHIPPGFSENELNSPAYLYDPDHLPGMHEVENPVTIDKDGNAIASTRMLMPGSYINVDGETFYYPQAYLNETDLKRAHGRNLEDL